MSSARLVIRAKKPSEHSRSGFIISRSYSVTVSARPRQPVQGLAKSRFPITGYYAVMQWALDDNRPMTPSRLRRSSETLKSRGLDIASALAFSMTFFA